MHVKLCIASGHALIGWYNCLVSIISLKNITGEVHPDYTLYVHRANISTAASTVWPLLMIMFGQMYVELTDKQLQFTSDPKNVLNILQSVRMLLHGVL